MVRPTDMPRNVTITITLSEEDLANAPVTIGYALASVSLQIREHPDNVAFAGRVVRRLEALFVALRDGTRA